MMTALTSTSAPTSASSSSQTWLTPSGEEYALVETLRARFLGELILTAVPVLRALGVCLSFRQDADTPRDVLVTHEMAGLSGSDGVTGQAGGGGGEDGKKSSVADSILAVTFEVICQGEALGIIELGGRVATSLDAARLVIDTVQNHVELQCVEESLLNELADNHENLRAVYEISTQLWSLRDTEQLLDQILERAISIQRGLKAVLWIARNDRLEAITGKGGLELASRTAGEGLVGRAISQLKPKVIKDNSRLLAVPDLEPELRHATAVMIAPVETRQGQRVALELWHDHESQGSFGSPTMHLALSIALQAAMVVENERLHKESLESERLRREVEIGSRIQQTLLLSRPPMDIIGAEIEAFSISSHHVDGDFFEFFRHDDYTLDLIVGDVMGKGIPAALLGAATKSEFHRAMSQLVLRDNTRTPDPAAVVRQAHTQLVSRFIELESFVTLCYARFELRGCRLTLVDCGHTRTIHYRLQEKKCTAISGENVPLGFREKEEYINVDCEFQVGDIFVFYSDGLTEARNPQGEEFGEDRLSRYIETHAEDTSQAIIHGLRQTVSDFAGATSFADDLTCVVIRILPCAPSRHQNFQLMIASATRELSRIREFLRLICVEHCVPSWNEEHLYELQVSVDEAASNIMEHAYRGREDQWIQIQAEIDENSVTVYLIHVGLSFDPSLAPPPKFDGSQDGGFGLYIINHYIDEVRYTVDERAGTNCIRLKKRR